MARPRDTGSGLTNRSGFTFMLDLSIRGNMPRSYAHPGTKVRRLAATRALIAPALLVTTLAFGAVFIAQPVVADQGSRDADSTVDENIKPGDDFFAYANGGWLKATDLPAGKDRWNARSEINELTRRQVRQLLDDASSAPAGSLARKVADFRAAYLNDAAIESRGLAPLQPGQNRIDRVRDKTDLARLLGAGLKADVDPMNLGVFRSAHVLGLATQASIHGETHYVAFLVQGGLGLPDRDAYLSSDPGMQAMRSRYRAAIIDVLAQVAPGAAPARTAPFAERADAVIALETAIAQSHATQEESGNERNADQLWTRADFASRAPGMNWPVFFAAAGLARQPAVVAWQPGAVKGLAALVASQPLSVWKDYLRVRLVSAYIDVLPSRLALHAPALRGETLAAAADNTRAARAIDATLSSMGEIVGRLYAERYFSPANKARVQAIANDIVNALARRVEAATWMSPASRKVALAKLKTLYFGVAYPDAWPDCSTLAIDPADAVGNLQRLAAWQYRRTLARLGKPVDKREWSVTPHWVGALLMFQQNAYNFTAALLQPPKFDPYASDAANYGAIGAIIGHEASHFIDTLGADYEVDGRFRRWWTSDDLAQFEMRAAPLVNQFSAYRPFPDVALNGKLTLTENVADLAGLAAAFDAHRTHLAASAGSRMADRAFVRQQDRAFFIGFARSWRAKYRDDALRKQAATNDHAPESYRIATVRNIDAWYDAFDVQPGQRLYLEPAARVRIW
jgi:predicted metalloendopeptidase